MEKNYFGGGTVEGVISTERYQRFRSNISQRFEDGTIAFSSIATLKFGFEILKKLGGMESINKFVNFTFFFPILLIFYYI